jgi:hypothetical protein
MTLFVHEVLTKVNAKRNKQDKIDLLQSNESWVLKDVLRGTYDESVVWSLPKGNVPYNPSKDFNAPLLLSKEHKNFHYFADIPRNKDMNPVKREHMFLRILEGVHPDDATLLVNMINKKPFDGVTKKVVEEAFPGLILR